MVDLENASIQLIPATPGANGLYSAQLSGTTVQFNGTPAPLIYTWAGQVMEAVDGLAFIGRNPLDKDNV
jgi:uncharacterized protein (TIGR03437 family)